MLSFNPPQSAPPTTDSTLKQWLLIQFRNVQKAANTAVEALFLHTQNMSPARANDGDVRLADGANWDPGFGQQMLYWYSGNDAEWKGLVHVGSGGTVTQATDKTTTVELDNDTGEITMNNATLAAGTIVSFTLTNANIGAHDVMVMNHVSGGTRGAYGFTADCVSGSATIFVRNNTASDLSQAVVIRFVRIPGATS